MAAWSNEYAESTGRSTATTNTVGGATKVTLTHTPGNNETWFYFFAFVLDHSITTADALARLFNTTSSTTLYSVNFEPQDATDRIGYASVVEVTYGSSPGSQSIALQYWVEAPGSTVGIAFAYIFGIKKGGDDQSIFASDEITRTSSTPLESQSLEGTFNGNFAIFYAARGQAGTSGDIAFRMFRDAVLVSGGAYTLQDATGWRTYPVMRGFEGESGTHDYSVDYASQDNATTVRQQYRGIVALDLDKFSAYDYAEDDSDTTTTALVTKLSLVYNVAVQRNHVAFGSWIGTMASTTLSNLMNFDGPNGAITETIEEYNESSDQSAFFGIKRESPTTGNKTWLLEHDAEGATVSTTNWTAILVIDLEEGAVVTSITPADLVQTVVLDNGTITQNHVITSASLTQLVVLDNDTLTQTHVLISAGLVQVVTLDNATLQLILNLLANDLTQLVTLDNVTFAQTHVLTSADLVQLVVLDNDTITQNQLLASSDLVQLVVLDNDAITQAHVLTSADLTQIVALEYCTEGVTFDGTNDWLSSGAPLTGVVDGPRGTLSILVKGAGGPGNHIMRGASAVYVAQIDSSRRITITVWGTGGEFLQFRSATGYKNDGRYHNVLISWDANFSAGNKKKHVAIDGVPVAIDLVTDTSVAFDVNYSGETDLGVYALDSGVQKYAGDTSDFWFSTTDYFDLDVATNCRKFSDAVGRPIDLGPNGELPTGTSPAIFLKGPAATYGNNLGTGGGFIVHGVLTDATSDPLCGGGPILTQTHVLTSADLIQLVFLDEVTVDIAGGGTIVVADLVHAVVLDNVTMAQNHILPSNDLVQTVFLDNDAITQNHVLTSASMIVNDGLGFARSLATVTLDGVNDYLVKTGGFATATERQGTLCCLLALGSLHVGERRRLLTNGNYIVDIATSDRIAFFCQDFSATATLDFNVSSAGRRLYPNDGLVHIAISWDVNFAAGLKKCRVAINGVSQPLFINDAFAAFDIVYNSTTNFGSRQGDFIQKLDAGVAEVWFNNSFFDFDLDSEKAKFFNLMTFAPADLGSTGQNPTGSSPLLYMKTPASAFPTNLGTGGDMTLTGSLDDTTSWMTSAPIPLAQTHTITSADIVQLVFLDNDTLLQNHVLTSAGLVQLVVLDGATFAQTHVLTAFDLVQIVVLDNDTLTQTHVLTSADLIQLVFLDNVDTGGTVSLITGDLTQLVVLDPATISQNQLLTSNDLVQQVFLDNTPITQAHILSSADLTQLVFLDSDTITQTHAITASDLVQLVFLDPVTLAQLHTLSAADLTQLVILDNATLAQLSILIADDLTQTVELGNDFITQAHAITAHDLTQLVFLDGLTGALVVSASVQLPRASVVVSGGPRAIIVGFEKSKIYAFGEDHTIEVGSED